MRHTPDEIRSLLSYEPETGLLRWKVRASSRRPIGSIAGTPLEGYIAVRVQGKGYKAHVLAFVIMTGAWPVHDVDHEDRVRSNNRWSNLRELTQAQNLQNHGGPNKNSTTKIRGVTLAWHTQRSKPWLGRVQVNHEHISKHFTTKDEAEAWVVSERRRLHEFCPENRLN